MQAMMPFRFSRSSNEPRVLCGQRRRPRPKRSRAPTNCAVRAPTAGTTAARIHRGTKAAPFLPDPAPLEVRMHGEPRGYPPRAAPDKVSAACRSQMAGRAVP
jgi:hypothetical protein